MFNKKNVCILAAILLTTSIFSSCSKSETNVISKNTENSVTTITTKAVVQNVANEEVTAAISGVPELTVSKIDLGGGYLIFADKSGRYILIDDKNRELASCYITDDLGRKILFVCYESNVLFQNDGEEITSFIYGGHSIHVENGVLYYDQSEVVYTDTSFSSYDISDDCTVCIDENNNYAVKNGKGIVVEKANIVDESGNSLDIAVENKVITATNVNNELVEAFRVNGDLVLLTNGNVIVNGEKLVAPHSNDIVVATVTTIATEITSENDNKATTTKKSSTTSKKTQQNNSTATGGGDYDYSYDNSNNSANSGNNGNSSVVTSAPAVVAQPVQTTTEATTSDNSTNISNQNISAETQEMLGYVNAVRAQYGLNPLFGLEILDSCSQIRANEISSNYNPDHSRPDGSSFSTVIDETGIYWYHVAENIACGTNCMTTVQEAFNAWMNSDGHRANILNPKLKYMAVAKSTNGDTTYWEQLFFNDEYVPD